MLVYQRVVFGRIESYPPFGENDISVYLFLIWHVMFVIYEILKANTQNKSYEQLEHPAGTHFFPENLWTPKSDRFR